MAADSNRTEAFVQLASAQMALIWRFGADDYLSHYCERHQPDSVDLATTGALMSPVTIGLCLQTS